ncbi:hypothetical protein B0H10DRAFT_2240055 [Mycena sp. CBHHK59/15]|nr:hypothetical protein B0H10DRAFT_2240602 [Mycena sp. CBHHK59/15]KAJ6561294.1 hypothetical protein B0H10DRAFT_2240055 [Mycena sp. CBHHK59/15]
MPAYTTAAYVFPTALASTGTAGTTAAAVGPFTSIFAATTNTNADAIAVNANASASANANASRPKKRKALAPDDGAPMMTSSTE